MYHKNLSNRRRMLYKHSRRKKRILKMRYGEWAFTKHTSLHGLSKAKCHCSCPMCTSKTGRDYCGTNTNSYATYKACDRRKLMACKDSLDEYNLKEAS